MYLPPNYNFAAYVESRAAKRDMINPGVHNVEVGTLAEERVEETLAHLREIGTPFSVHFPLTVPADYPYKPRAAMFLSGNPQQRADVLALLEHNLKLAGWWGAQYMVLHLTDDDYPPPIGEGAKLAAQVGRKLAQLGEYYNVPLLVEYIGKAETFHRISDFTQMFDSNPGLGCCLDSGHLYKHSLKFGGDYLEDARQLLPYVQAMHLWQTRKGDKNKHVPVGPSLKPQDGWIDLPALIALVSKGRPELPIVFEPQFKLHQDEVRFLTGMAWVERLQAELALRLPLLDQHHPRRPAISLPHLQRQGDQHILARLHRPQVQSLDDRHACAEQGEMGGVVGGAELLDGEIINPHQTHTPIHQPAAGIGGKVDEIAVELAGDIVPVLRVARLEQHAHGIGRQLRLRQIVGGNRLGNIAHVEQRGWSNQHFGMDFVHPRRARDEVDGRINVRPRVRTEAVEADVGSVALADAAQWLHCKPWLGAIVGGHPRLQGERDIVYLQGGYSFFLIQG